LLIASVLATNMAGCSAFMVNSGALFTKSLYARYLVKHKPDAHYLWVGRVSGLLITLASALYAVFLVERILYSFLLLETMATYMGVSLLAGICWKRATRWGAMASLAVALVVNFSLYAARGQRLDYWDPWVFLTALGAGLATMVIVSLATPREAPERLDLFYGRLQTPADAGDPAPGAQQPSPEHAANGQQLLVVNLLHPRQGAAGQGFLRAYREDLGGFVKGWGIVLALVGLVWLMFR
jgi:SSS family solute:Na+ symporter